MASDHAAFPSSGVYDGSDSGRPGDSEALGEKARPLSLDGEELHLRVNARFTLQQKCCHISRWASIAALLISRKYVRRESVPPS